MRQSSDLLKDRINIGERDKTMQGKMRPIESTRVGLA